eukprot:6172473-Pleurochrysis_carterae.AAC.1
MHPPCAWHACVRTTDPTQDRPQQNSKYWPVQTHDITARLQWKVKDVREHCASEMCSEREKIRAKINS